jgi:hypothetical protein
MRHKYGTQSKSKSKDNSSVGCIKCGMVRQYVSGLPTYFIDDNVFDKAPVCDGRLLNE